MAKAFEQVQGISLGGELFAELDQSGQSFANSLQLVRLLSEFVGDESKVFPIEVAQACSGMRMLVAFFALAVAMQN